MTKERKSRWLNSVEVSAEVSLECEGYQQVFSNVASRLQRMRERARRQTGWKNNKIGNAILCNWLRCLISAFMSQYKLESRRRVLFPRETFHHKTSRTKRASYWNDGISLLCIVCLFVFKICIPYWWITGVSSLNLSSFFFFFKHLLSYFIHM